MQKVRYEIDPYNRLVLSGTDKKSDLARFRRVLDGRFRIDADNNLSYRAKAPLSEGEHIPHEIKFKGEWSLTDDHRLCLILDKSLRKALGDRIILDGEILDVNGSSLSFAVQTVAKDNTKSTYVLNLGGSWKADSNNRLTFYARRENGTHDALTLNGVWEINKNHEIVYQYKKTDRKKRSIRTHVLTFKGYWDIKDKVRISYVLRVDNASAFTFKTSAGIFKKDYIEYEAGISLADRAKPIKRTITINGRWRLKKDVGLTFEIEHEGGKARNIIFGAEAKITDKDKVSFRLKDDVKNKDIGVDLELSREIFEGEGEIFLRTLRSGKELAIYAGGAWRW